MNYTLNAEPGHINFSPVGFRLAAEDFLRCSEAFQPNKFSLVPYFLCCRAIELAFKAIHLETRSQAEVKRDFGHDLKASYDALPPDKRTLSPSETELLEKSSVLYRSKAFEYVQPGDAGTAYSRFPSIVALAELAQRILSERPAEPLAATDWPCD